MNLRGALSFAKGLQIVVGDAAQKSMDKTSCAQKLRFAIFFSLVPASFVRQNYIEACKFVLAEEEQDPAR